MEKKTAAQEFLDSKISRDKETIRRSQAVSMMVQYSSLQSEEKDKELQEAIITIHSENQKRLQLESEFNVYKKEADAALALGEKIITRKDEEIAEKDEVILNLQKWRKNQASRIHDMAEEIQAKDRRIKELEEAFENLIDAILDS